MEGRLSVDAQEIYPDKVTVLAVDPPEACHAVLVGRGAAVRREIARLGRASLVVDEELVASDADFIAHRGPVDPDVALLQLVAVAVVAGHPPDVAVAVEHRPVPRVEAGRPERISHPIPLVPQPRAALRAERRTPVRALETLPHHLAPRIVVELHPLDAVAVEGRSPVGSENGHLDHPVLFIKALLVPKCPRLVRRRSPFERQKTHFCGASARVVLQLPGRVARVGVVLPLALFALDLVAASVG